MVECSVPVTLKLPVRWVLRAHKSSSWFKITVYFRESSFSRDRRKADGLDAMAFWVPLLSQYFLFSDKNVFRNLSILGGGCINKRRDGMIKQGVPIPYLFDNEGKPRVTEPHFFKPKGPISFARTYSGKRLRRKGQWSELIRGRWVTFASRKLEPNLDWPNTCQC